MAARGRALEKLFRALPPGSYIFQLGVMFARNMPAIRVCIRDIKVEEVVPMLLEVGWQGEQYMLASTLTALAQRCERIDLDIDVGESVLGKVGLECYFGRDLKTLERIAHLGSWLVDNGCATSAKVDAMIQFHGLVHQDRSSDLWPDYLLKMAILAGHGVANQMNYWLHHIKVVFQPKLPLSAKAYLGVSHDRMSRENLREQMNMVRYK
ncbi:hypothetical protein A3709_11985 [Halioglobus sp. HI00S01]|nr:hypothetical protein A3709_11985 [Halioglobus sp. HI00S01]